MAYVVAFKVAVVKRRMYQNNEGVMRYQLALGSVTLKSGHGVIQISILAIKECDMIAYGL